VLRPVLVGTDGYLGPAVAGSIHLCVHTGLDVLVGRAGLGDAVGGERGCAIAEDIVYPRAEGSAVVEEVLFPRGEVKAEPQNDVGSGLVLGDEHVILIESIV
jgi:hypothetical protein